MYGSTANPDLQAGYGYAEYPMPPNAVAAHARLDPTTEKLIELSRENGRLTGETQEMRNHNRTLVSHNEALEERLEATERKLQIAQEQLDYWQGQHSMQRDRADTAEEKLKMRLARKPKVKELPAPKE